MEKLETPSFKNLKLMILFPFDKIKSCYSYCAIDFIHVLILKHLDLQPHCIRHSSIDPTEAPHNGETMLNLHTLGILHPYSMTKTQLLLVRS